MFLIFFSTGLYMPASTGARLHIAWYTLYAACQMIACRAHKFSAAGSVDCVLNRNEAQQRIHIDKHNLVKTNRFFTTENPHSSIVAQYENFAEATFPQSTWSV